MAVNIKDLYGNPGKRFKNINKIPLTLFTLLVFVSCVVIFPGMLFKILVSIYILESFTWIPIQILYVHGHFKDYAIWNHMY